MNAATVSALESESQSSGLLDWLKAGTDLYSTIRGNPVIPPAPVVPKVVSAPPFNWQPVAIVGGVVALVIAAVLFFRK